MKKLNRGQPLSTEGQALVRDAVKEIIDADPVLKKWVANCRSPIDKDRCERNVLGECDRCDRVRH